MNKTSRIEEITPEVQVLLERRAERLRAQVIATEEEVVFWVAEFPVGEERYAIALDSLRAAVPLRMVTAVPLSAPQVIGVLRFQGETIAALSLASLLGSRGWREDPAVLLVVDPGWGQLTALDCEAIPKPAALPLTLVEEARARGKGAVLEITTPDMRQINLIELSRLLSRRTVEGRHDR